MEVDVKALEIAHVARAGDLSRLDHPRTIAARGLGAERWALVAVQLQHRQAEILTHLDHPLERRVDEHPAQLHLATHGRGDASRLGQRAAAWAALVEDHAERPCSELG